MIYVENSSCNWQKWGKVLESIKKRGKANGLKNLRFLNSFEIVKREKFIRGTSALLVPRKV